MPTKPCPPLRAGAHCPLVPALCVAALAVTGCVGAEHSTEPSELQVHNGQVVLHGDILLGSLQDLAAPPDAEQHGAQQKAVGLANQSRGDDSGREFLIYEARLWRDGVIPYRFEGDLRDNALARAWVERAIAHFHERTSIRWVHRPNPGLFTNHVVLTNRTMLGGALSFVGDWKGSYAQKLWFGGKVPSEPVPDRIVSDNHRESFQVILHEMGHAVGLWHEMQHPERDRWDGDWFFVPHTSHDPNTNPLLRLFFLDFERNHAMNFGLLGSSHALGEVNWESVMWYDEDKIFAESPRLPFSNEKVFKDDERLFRAEGGQPGEYGPSPQLTDGDIRGIELMYGRPLEPVADALRVGAQLHVFAKLDSGHVGHLVRDDGKWVMAHRWAAPLDWADEPYIKGAPEARLMPDGRLGIAARGPRDGLLLRLLPPASPQWNRESWLPLPLHDADGPVRIQSHIELATVPGSPTLFFLDDSRRLRSQVCEAEAGGDPDAWQCHDVPLRAAPLARSLTLDEGTMPAIVDTRGAVRLWQDGQWQRVCGEPTAGVAGRLAVVGDTQQGPLDLLARDSDGQLLHCARRQGRFSGWRALDLNLGSPPVAERADDGTVRYWARAENGRVLAGVCDARRCERGLEMGDGKAVGAPVRLPAATGDAAAELLVRDSEDRLQAWSAGWRQTLSDAQVRW